MTMMHLIPALLSLALLGAHVLRGAHYAFLAVAIFTILLMAVRAPWSRRTAQVVLGFGVIEWLRTLAILVGGRVAADLPFARLAAILGVVALLTALAAVILESERVKRFYRSA